MDIRKVEKAYNILNKHDVMDRLSVVFGIYKPMDKHQFVAQVIANNDWISKIHVFLDMDNTLVRFSYGKSDDIDVLERCLQTGFYENLDPMKNIDIYEALMLIGVNVHILSACVSTVHCKEEKLKSLKKHMPYILKKQVIFCNVGENKAECAKKRAHLDNLEYAVLVDDWKGNLLAWQSLGGIAIKKAMSYKTRPYPTLLDHRDAVDMILSLVKEKINY